MTPIESALDYINTHSHTHVQGGADQLSADDLYPFNAAVADILVATTVNGRIVFRPYSISIPGSAGLRNVLAIDNGETTPTWQADEHEVLSVRHSDTLTGTVVAGDLMVGNSTPKWARLARSVPSDPALMNVVGLSGGETVPSWKAAEHSLLAVRHSDTIAGTVVRGDIIRGNSTPAWERLARPSTPAVLYNDATDTAWDTMAWTAVAHAGGNFTAATGAWTVDAADQVDFSYRLIGKTMIVNFRLLNTTTSLATANLRITLPASKTSNRNVTSMVLVDEAGTSAVAYCQTNNASSTTLTIAKVDGTNIGALTNTLSVMGEITFETT